MGSPKTLILLAHGSRAKATFAEMQDLAVRMTGRLAALPGQDGMQVKGAFLSLTRPDLAEAVAEAAAGGSRDIRILPLFLFTGKHILEDVPGLVEALRTRFPDISLTLLKPIGQHAAFADFLLAAADLQ